MNFRPKITGIVFLGLASYGCNGKDGDKAPPYIQPEDKHLAEAQPGQGESEQPDSTTALTGNETQNGDWSFAERGRQLLAAAQKELVEQIKAQPAASFTNYLANVGSQEPHITGMELQDRLIDALQALRMPENEELLSKKVTSRFFAIEVNGFGKISVMPELDYFLNFGAEWQKQERILRMQDVKRLLLESIGSSLGVPSSFAERLLEAATLQVSFPQDLRLHKIVTDQIEFSAINQHINILSTHHLLAFGESLIKTLAGVSITVSEPFNFAAIKPLIFSPSDCESEGELECIESMRRFDWRLPVQFSFKNQKDGQWIEIVTELYGSIKLLPGKDASGAYYLRIAVHPEITSNGSKVLNFKAADTKETIAYFDVDLDGMRDPYWIVNDHLSNGTYSLNLAVTKKAIGSSDQFYQRAMTVLEVALSSIIQMINKLEPNHFAGIVNTYAGPSNRTEMEPKVLHAWYLDLLSKIQVLGYEELQEASLGIKNFDYNDEALLVRPAFYLNFGSNGSPLETYLKVLEVQKLIAHESGHLFGMSDQESAEFARHLLAVGHENTDLGGDFLQMNPNQLKDKTLVADAVKASNEYLVQDAEALKQVLLSEGLMNGELTFHAESLPKDDHRCFIIDEPIDCTQYYTSKYWEETVTITIKSAKRELKFNVDVRHRLNLDVISDGHGIFSSYWEMKHQSTAIEVIDSESGNVVGRFDLAQLRNDEGNLLFDEYRHDNIHQIF